MPCLGRLLPVQLKKRRESKPKQQRGVTDLLEALIYSVPGANSSRRDRVRPVWLLLGVVLGLPQGGFYQLGTARELRSQSVHMKK